MITYYVKINKSKDKKTFKYVIKVLKGFFYVMIFNDKALKGVIKSFKSVYRNYNNLYTF